MLEPVPDSSADSSAQDERAAEKILRIPKLFRNRRVPLGHLLVVGKKKNNTKTREQLN